MTSTRRLVLVSLAALGALGGACSRHDQSSDKTDAARPSVPGQAPPTAPNRKAGLWELRTSFDGASDAEGGVQRVSMCLDAASEARMSLFSAQASKEMCGESTQSRQLDGSWKFRSVCSMGSGGRTVSEGVASGDFTSHYQVRAHTSTSGASVPQMNRESSMIVDAAWQGPCPEGWRGGDIQIAGMGPKMNILELATGR